MKQYFSQGPHSDAAANADVPGRTNIRASRQGAAGWPAGRLRRRGRSLHRAKRPVARANRPGAMSVPPLRHSRPDRDGIMSGAFTRPGPPQPGSVMTGTPRKVSLSRSGRSADPARTGKIPAPPCEVPRDRKSGGGAHGPAGSKMAVSMGAAASGVTRATRGCTLTAFRRSIITEALRAAEIPMPAQQPPTCPVRLAQYKTPGRTVGRVVEGARLESV